MCVGAAIGGRASDVDHRAVRCASGGSFTEDKKKKSETERVREKRGKKRKSINKGAQKIHSGSR